MISTCSSWILKNTTYGKRWMTCFRNGSPVRHTGLDSGDSSIRPNALSNAIRNSEPSPARLDSYHSAAAAVSCSASGTSRRLRRVTLGPNVPQSEHGLAATQSPVCRVRPILALAVSAPRAMHLPSRHPESPQGLPTPQKQSLHAFLLEVREPRSVASGRHQSSNGNIARAVNFVT